MATTQDKSKPLYPMIMLAVYLVGAIFAFYLSWSCNSNWQRGTIAKVFFAMFSASQSWSYCFIYMFYKRGLCNPAAFHKLPH